MSATLRVDGMNEMLATLRTLPDELKQHSLGPVVKSNAEAMAADLKASYHKHTGTLANRVVVEHDVGGSPLRSKVRSKAPHAHFYEYGTVRRFTKGTGAYRGTMPAQPTLVPTAIRWRERMLRAVRARLESMRVPGFRGSPGARPS